MQDAFERIKAWASEHPWLAALIALAVIVVVYLLYKNFSQGSGASASSSTDQGTTDQGGIPTTTDQGSSTSSASPVPTFTGSEQGSNAGSIIPSNLGLNGMSSGGETTFPPAQSGIGSYGLPAAQALTPTIGEITGHSTGGLLNVASGQISAPIPVAAAQPALNVKAPQQLFAPEKPVHAGGASQTPAQQIGKGRLFTGTYQGVQYVNGYPASYGGVNPSGGYTSVIANVANPGQPISISLTPQDINYGATGSQVLNRPGEVLHGH